MFQAERTDEFVPEYFEQGFLSFVRENGFRAATLDGKAISSENSVIWAGSKSFTRFNGKLSDVKNDRLNVERENGGMRYPVTNFIALIDPEDAKELIHRIKTKYDWERKHNNYFIVPRENDEESWLYDFVYKGDILKNIMNLNFYLDFPRVQVDCMKIGKLEFMYDCLSFLEKGILNTSCRFCTTTLDWKETDGPHRSKLYRTNEYSSGDNYLLTVYKNPSRGLGLYTSPWSEDRDPLKNRFCVWNTRGAHKIEVGWSVIAAKLKPFRCGGYIFAPYIHIRQHKHFHFHIACATKVKHEMSVLGQTIASLFLKAYPKVIRGKWDSKHSLDIPLPPRAVIDALREGGDTRGLGYYKLLLHMVSTHHIDKNDYTGELGCYPESFEDIGIMYTENKLIMRSCVYEKVMYHYQGNIPTWVFKAIN
jgi:hypothetical protein